MTYKKKTTSKLDFVPLPAPTSVGADPKLLYPPLDVRSTVSYPSGPYPMKTLALSASVPIKTPTTVATNTAIDPT